MSKKIYQIEVKTEFSNKLKVHLEKALEADPKFSEVHFQLALISKNDGNNKVAENYLKKAIDLDNQQIHDFEKRSKKLLEKFQFQNAKFIFRKVLEKKNHCARMNIQLSNIYKNQNKLSKSQACLEYSIELNPASSKGHRNLGILLLQKKNYDAAQRHIEKALELDYSDCLTHFNLGTLMKQRKKYKDAAFYFLSALDINPKFVVCMLEMAHLNLILKNKIQAKKYYQRALDISPGIKRPDLDKVLGD